MNKKYLIQGVTKHLPKDNLPDYLRVVILPDDCEAIMERYAEYKCKTQMTVYDQHLNQQSGWRRVEKELPQEGQIIDGSTGSNNLRCIYRRGEFYRFIDISDHDRALDVYYPGIKLWKPLTYPPVVTITNSEGNPSNPI